MLVRRIRVPPSNIEGVEQMTDIGIPGDREQLDAQVDELLERIRTLVSEQAILESERASEFELRANRDAIARLKERLARLVARQQARSTPPAA
jgi:hypothetical protein